MGYSTPPAHPPYRLLRRLLILSFSLQSRLADLLRRLVDLLCPAHVASGRNPLAETACHKWSVFFLWGHKRWERRELAVWLSNWVWCHLRGPSMLDGCTDRQMDGWMDAWINR